MLKHIVMWNLRPHAEGASAAENLLVMKQRLESLKSKIPEILELEVGLPLRPTEGMPDVVLATTFQDEAALGIYQKHPEHLQVAEFIQKITEGRHLVDYLNS